MTLPIILSGTASPKRDYLKLETRAQRQLPNQMQPQKPLQAIRDLAKIHERTCRATRLVSASTVCNCYGLAFASRRTALVDENAVFQALSEDGYKLVPFAPIRWDYGDVVLYRTSDSNASHVAVIVELRPGADPDDIEVRVLSAWGDQGEYVHDIDPGHPTLGKPYAVYSLRLK